MSCDVTKLEYLKETKNQIKQTLVKYGSDISDDTPFRDYSEKICVIGEKKPVFGSMIMLRGGIVGGINGKMEVVENGN